ncbi:MAG: ABC transporter substrate-binding protein [Deinococcota bacterium]|nr:ABC transporter substrate-binding protein [Deinococcota bacterium]
MKRIGSLLIVIGMVLAGAAAFAQGPIRVGSKNFTEQLILGNLIVTALQEAGLEVVDNTNLGGTGVVRDSLLTGEIDVYAEYTGTAISNFFRDVEADIPEGASGDAQLSYETVSSLDEDMNDLVWLDAAPANNTYAIAVSAPFAEEHGVSSAADLAAYINEGNAVRLATNDEFAQRPDGLQSFEDTYGFAFGSDNLLIIAGGASQQTLQAMAEGQVDAAMVFATDGALQAYDVVVLSDEDGAQPVFQPAPVVRGEVLRANPEIAEVLNPIFATLDAETLQELNARVEVDGENVRDVVRDFLQEHGFSD